MATTKNTRPDPAAISSNPLPGARPVVVVYSVEHASFAAYVATKRGALRPLKGGFIFGGICGTGRENGTGGGMLSAAKTHIDSGHWSEVHFVAQ